MKLLITKSRPTYIWDLERSKRLTFTDFSEQDLFQPGPDFVMQFPWEITSRILAELFRIYLKTFNFDEANQLLLVKKNFIHLIYRSIYGDASIFYHEKYRRLSNTLNIIAEIYDTYLTVLCQRQFSIFKIVRTGHPGHDPVYPWDFNFDFFIEALSGIVNDGEAVAQYSLGPTYGDLIVLNGKWKTQGYFECTKLATPIINLKLVDIFDTLQLTPALAIGDVFLSFIKLLKYTFGPYSLINLMVTEENETSPFVTHSNNFYSF